MRSDTTINYQGRQHDVDFKLKPYYGAENLTFNQSQSTLELQYKKTLLYKDRFAVKTSGLDPLGVRPAQIGFPALAISDPEMPIPNSSFSHLTLDCEGLVLNADGSCVQIPTSLNSLFIAHSASGSAMNTAHTFIALMPLVISCKPCSPTTQFCPLSVVT